MPEIGAVTFSTIAARIKMIPDAVINKATLLKKCKEKGRMFMNKGGTVIRWPVRSSASNIGGSTSTWGTSGARTTQPFTEMVVNWRQYKWLPTINDYQVDLNENAGVSKLFDMAEQQLNEVRQDASARFETHMYADAATLSTGDDAGSTPIDGLESIIDDDNTYGGLARTGNTFWQGQIVSVTNPIQDDNNNSLTNLYEGMMQAFNACSRGKGGAGNAIVDTVAGDFDRPETIVTTDTLFRAYWASLEPSHRYVTAQAGPLEELTFGTANAVTWDPFCTASRMYFLNWKHLQFWCSGSQLIELKKVVEREAPVSKVYVLTSQCQFFSTNPRYLGAIRTTGT